MCEEATDATKCKLSMIGMEIRDHTKWASNRIELELQAAISPIRVLLEHIVTEALQNVVVCRAALHNSIAEVCRAFPGTDTLMVDSEAGTAVVESGQTSSLVLEQVFKDGVATGGARYQWGFIVSLLPVVS